MSMLRRRSWRALLVLAVAGMALLGVAGATGARLLAPPPLSDLPAAATVSYAVPGGAAPLGVGAAMRGLARDKVDGAVQWHLIQLHMNGVLSQHDMNAEMDHIRAGTWYDVRHARYVLLNDSSTVMPIGFTSTLPALRRRPVWLVPIRAGDGAGGAAAAQAYLVLDARAGGLLERLYLERVDPLAACALVAPGPLRVNQALCMVTHASDPHAYAERSPP